MASTIDFQRPLAGSVVPLSFLRGVTSLGIGNFANLKTYIDTAFQRGEKIIQLLPLNDTGSEHLWPYSSLSSFAINPVYICVQDVVTQYQDYLSQDQLRVISGLIQDAKKFESMPIIEYPQVRQATLEILQAIFNAIYPKILDQCQEFANQFEWVLDYAIFSVVLNQTNNTGWMHWPDVGLRQHDKDMISYFYSQNIMDVDFYIFCQKIALEQLKSVRAYANEKGIYIKGDIPILVDRNSADVWGRSYLFAMEYGAGAPPDIFTSGGQEWGSPPLVMTNPQALGYFISRFQYGQQYMDMVRIDHVLGLFRLMIWNRNLGNIANQGFFYPQRDEYIDMVIQRNELAGIGIDPDQFTRITGVITDNQDLGVGARVCVELGLAKWIKNNNQIAWITDSRLENQDSIDFYEWNQYSHNLNYNEDYIRELLRKKNLPDDVIWKIVNARRRLQNMLGYYMGDSDRFFFTVYGRETWHFMNLTDWQKQRFEDLLRIKEASQYAFWRQFGKTILARLQSETSLFLCAEDLGRVDPYIPDVLKELGIPGITIIRWAPSFRKEGQRYLTVLTTSTHDTSTFHQWWNEPYTSIDDRSRFIREFMNREDWDVSRDLSQNQLQEVLLEIYKAPVLFVIQPYWEILHVFYHESDKRINLPGSSDPANWCCRMEQSLETYVGMPGSAFQIHDMIRQSGRIDQ